ncbi:hypothetical protein [Sphingorhabdus sp. SMR4y]|uniref:hypothetical protein n=1 Tax=Sphingorhabdus sp. SMR4y TaxID=2584094 RepID=UPI000B6061FF|nr:hypothetical protein [Sphingorhabdus sp. SMR4y]ASK88494.1 hypothetical protein SPHFLASMR4Y_01747 [Sphingorhabdus sp. SMR4y]
MSMPAAWQAGYDWGYGKGPFAGLSAMEAPEAAGYPIDDDANSELWDAGAEAALNEQMEASQ